MEVARAFFYFSYTLMLSPIATKSSKSGFFWHVTDFHYDPSYWDEGWSCSQNVTRSGLFGNQWCDANWELINSTVFNMAATKQDADFVIWTGDSVAHISDDKTDLESNLKVINDLTQLLTNAFPDTTEFLPSLGNHDFYPDDQANFHQDEFYVKAAKVWERWIPGSGQQKQFIKGGFYSMLVSKKLRLMSLNTNLYYDKNKLTKGMTDPAGQFAWMESVLNRARRHGEKVIVTAHVAPGVRTPNVATWMYTDHQERYVSILTFYSDVIQASHYGHDHSDGFKIIQSKDDSTKAVAQFVAPSVTPARFFMNGIPTHAHNPGIRLVEYDKQTGKHLNYVQYYLNFTEANVKKETKWVKLYDFKETYSVDDMSVNSLRQIFDRIKSEDGESLAQSYCNNALVSKHNKPCSQEYRWIIVCGGLYYRMEEAKKCVHKFMFGSGSPGFLTMQCPYVFISAYLLTKAIVNLLCF